MMEIKQQHELNLLFMFERYVGMKESMNLLFYYGYYIGSPSILMCSLVPCDPFAWLQIARWLTKGQAKLKVYLQSVRASLEAVTTSVNSVSICHLPPFNDVIMLNFRGAPNIPTAQHSDH